MSRMVAFTLAIAFVTSQVQADEGCPIAKAMGKLPKMAYKVGDQEVCCPSAAAKLAKDQDAAVTYLVGKESFDNQGAATVALAKVTEKFVKDFATPCKCEASGNVTVAGKELCCDVAAGATAKLVGDAMKQVEMTYLVGDKECHCPTQAETLAKESGAKTLFVVAGEKTPCSATARLNLARAKYKAAVEAITKAEKKAEPAKS